MQFEELGGDYKFFSMQAGGGKNREEIEQKLMSRQLENQKNSKRTLSKKEQRGDGFLNKAIRSMTIAAYLRCLYASVEYAPNVELRKQAIANIRDPLMFRAITQLCDATNFDEHANIGAKYLRVMRSIVKLPREKETETMDMLMHYEFIAIVIQKVLSKIVDKMKKDIQLTQGDQVTIYEISLTFYTLVMQTNNFVFSTLDLLQLHYKKETDLWLQENLVKKTKLPEFLEPENEAGPYKRRCQYTPHRYVGPVTPDNYQVDVPVLREQQSVQSMLVEYMVMKLFSRQSIFSLIDILFKDMKEDYKIFEVDDEEEEALEADEEEQPGDEGESAGSGGSEGSDGEEEMKVKKECADPLKVYYEDIEKYLDCKSILTIETIKDIVGVIMSSCQNKLSYDILETIMKGVVFEKKKLRESFMQEILNTGERTTVGVELEKHINVQNYNIELKIQEQKAREEAEANPGEEPKPVKVVVPHERVVSYSILDVNNTLVAEPGQSYDAIIDNEFRDVNFKKRIFVLTTHRILILKNLPNRLRCPTCPDYKFCPRGPITEYAIHFPDIETIINFKQLPQKLVIKYHATAKPPTVAKFQMTLNIPTITETDKLLESLSATMQELLSEENKYRKKASDRLNEKPVDKHNPLVKYPIRKRKLAVSYTDRFVRKDIRRLIESVANNNNKNILGNNDSLEEREKEKEKYKVELINATLVHSDFFNQRFFKDFVESKFTKVDGQLTSKGLDDAPALADYFAQNLTLGDEDANVVPNSIHVGIAGQSLVLLREKWQDWVFYKDRKQVTQRLDRDEVLIKRRDCRNNAPPQEDTVSPNVSKSKALENSKASRDSRKNWVPTPVTDEQKAFGKKMKEYSEGVGPLAAERIRECQGMERSLFQVLAVVHIQEIVRIDVHRGRQPSVELACQISSEEEANEDSPGQLKTSRDGPEESKKEDKTIHLLFTGDMERQKFIQWIMDLHEQLLEPEEQEDPENDEEQLAEDLRLASRDSSKMKLNDGSSDFSKLQKTKYRQIFEQKKTTQKKVDDRD